MINTTSSILTPALKEALIGVAVLFYKWTVHICDSFGRKIHVKKTSKHSDLSDREQDIEEIIVANVVWHGY